MIAKLVAILCIIGFANAGYLGGYHGHGFSGLGYSGVGHSGLGYSGIGYGVAPAYSYAAPVVTKAVIPAVYTAPAISHVSSYQVHSAPIVKSYVAPVAYGGLDGGHGYGSYGYGSYGYGGYGHGGYGSKYLW